MKQVPISRREQQILHLIAYGYSTKMIAAQLYLSEHTVDSHRRNLLAKLEVRNTASMVRRAFEIGLMKVGQVAAALLLIILMITHDAQAQDEFITVWKTDNPGVTTDTDIRIPGTGTYDISWQEVGNPANYGSINSVSGAYILKLGTVGTYQISISKTIEAIRFNNGGDKEKIIEVIQWGGAKWTSFDGLFSGCSNLTISASDNPDLALVNTMKSAFANVFDITSDITGWDVSTVNNMQGTFNNLYRLDQNIGSWNITNVTNMANMLKNCDLTKRTYDNILRGWNAQSVQSNVNIGAHGNQFCNGAKARDSLINDNGWSFTGDGTSPNCVPFVTTWQTTDPAPSVPIRITIPTTGTGYDYDVDIGNDGSIEAYGVTGDYTHDFATVGSYEIAIYGDFPRIYVNDGLHADKLLSIDQWGDIEWQSMNNAFSGCSNMEANYSVRPDLEEVTDMTDMFAGCSLFNGFVHDWELFGVTHMLGMFSQAAMFNRDLSTWDVSAVTNMNFMFNSASSFDHDLSAWDISSVEHMDYMLDLSGMSTGNYDATLISWAGQSVSSNITLGAVGLTFCDAVPAREHLEEDHGWTINGDTREVGCFRPFITTWFTDNPGSCATCVEIPISSSPSYTYSYDVDWENDGIYDTIGVTGSILHDYGIADTFQVAIRGDFPSIYFFNHVDVEKIISIDQWGDMEWETMGAAFRGCINLNGQASDNPDLSNVTSLAQMFWGASSFNQDISQWNVDSVTTMSNMFNSAISFNQDIGGWSVENVSDMNQMFLNASSFNQNIGSWDVSNGKFMGGMFSYATSFNQDVSEWELDSVTTMSSMFSSASSFNQDIGDWNVGNVTQLNRMFRNASSFNQDISGWDISKVTEMDDFLDNSGMSISNYDALIIGWEASGLHIDNTDLDADGLEYCTSGAARQRLMNDHGWTFNDDGPTQGGVNDWLGNSALNWNDSDANWSSMTIPSQCHDVTLTVGSDIIIQSGQSGYGGTLDIEAGGIFEVELGATLDIIFVPQ